MSDPIPVPEIPWQSIDLSNKLDKARNSLDTKKILSATGNEGKLQEACAEFESLFIFYLLKEMRATIPKSGLIGGGIEEEIYTSILDSRLAKELSSRGGIGISAILFDQYTNKQGNTRGTD